MALLHDRSGERKYLNRAERLAFYNSAQCVANDAHRAFCLTLFYTGCRISEALALTPDRLDEGECALVFRTLKQRGRVKHRAVAIPSAHMRLLLSFSQNRRGLWPFGRTTGWKIIKASMTSAGLEGIKATPKGLRHGFAIACISEGIPLPIVQKWLGHARMETTGNYLDFVGDDERALAKRIWFPAEEPSG